MKHEIEKNNNSIEKISNQRNVITNLDFSNSELLELAFKIICWNIEVNDKQNLKDKIEKLGNEFSISIEKARELKIKILSTI